MSESSAIAAWVSESGPRTVDELFSGVSLGGARVVQDGVVTPLTSGSAIALSPGVDVAIVAEVHSVFPVSDVVGQVVRVRADRPGDTTSGDTTPGDGRMVVADGFCDEASPERRGMLRLVIDGAQIRDTSVLVLQVGLMRSRMTDQIPFRIDVM